VSDRFAVCAGRLAGIVCRQLGWQPAAFWEATPAEIAAIFASDQPAEGESLSRNEFENLMERDDHE